MLERGKASRVWDVDGNEYVDFLMSFGALIHGHAHPRIVSAVTNAIATGSHFASSTPAEAEAAERASLLRELSDYTEHVIATGGGVILRDENRALLKQGIVVWLQAPAEILWQRLQQDDATAEKRPDLAQGGLAEIDELLRLRAPLYEECHDFAVNTAAQSPQQVAELIYGWIKQAQG